MCPVRPIFALWIVSIFAACSPSLQAAPLELDVLRQQYDKVHAERVTGPHETALTELNTNFTAALDAAITAAKQAGKLDDVLAIQADAKRIAEKHPLPAEDTEGTPEALKKLRAIYRDQSARIETDRATNANALIGPFSAKLEELEITLTRADRIEDATLVRTYRESLATAPLLAPAMAEKPAPATSGAAPAAAPTFAGMKGDDRKAAEWILSLAVEGSNTNVTVQVGTRSITCKKIAELPAADFFVTAFHLDGYGQPMPRLVTNEETAILAGLTRLKQIMFNKAGITDEGLQFVASCPEVFSITLHNLNLSDDCFRHFQGLKKLTKVNFTSEKTPMTGAGVALLEGTSIESLEFLSGGFEDSAFPQLLRLKNLKSLKLSGTRITDSGIATLKALPRLTSLHVSGTAITPEAIMQLRGLKLESISLGMPSTWSEITPQLPALAAAFPDVVEMNLPRYHTYTVESLEPLVAAFPDLRRLEVSDPKFEPGAFEVLLRFADLTDFALYAAAYVGEAELALLPTMKSLETLSLGGTTVTDTTLMNLAKIKNLKALSIKKTNVTPAGLEAFKKTRPDVVIK